MMTSTKSTLVRVLLCVLLNLPVIAKLLSSLNKLHVDLSSSTDHQSFFSIPHKQISKVLKSLGFPIGNSTFFPISSNRIKRQLRQEIQRERVLLVYYSFLPGLNRKNLGQNIRTFFFHQNSRFSSHRTKDFWPFWPFSARSGGITYEIF
jgi:hypothetical protein